MPSETRVESRCPRCLRPREGNPDGSLSFAPPCPECGTKNIPERPPKLTMWVCPYCMGPASRPDHNGNIGHSYCSHAHPGERGVTQPRPVLIEVVPAEPFEPKEIPHDKFVTERTTPDHA